MARALLVAGANVDATEEDDWTALMFSAQGGHVEVCAFKPSVEQLQDVTGRYRTLQNHEQVAGALLEAGPNVDATEEDDFTPLIFAAQNGHTEVRALQTKYVIDVTDVRLWW